ncbi:DUF6130 family protein [Xanthomarina sp. F1114]|uniref:T9SS type A sorting domain-containing protein n=1 Tax=Xanthomarina sp. F1114 TaxID=2996019 RepID=UPI00225E3D44|nr:T9SS type A sorting domain-containing protein [Xanthomarina sp. F1114]MCX7547002.1 DUF6130 family protein [Xanthomarina sp. F1114]
MKKIYLLLFTFLTVSFSFGQELLVNGTFESWDDATTPTGWTHVENVEQEATEVHSGSYSVKQSSTGGTKDLGQRVTGIVPGNSYTVTVWYKVESGDGTDARIWSKWATDGSNDHTTDADVLQGVGPGGYFDNNGNVWTEYSVTVTAPATANEFYFEVRTYSGAVVYWDDFSLFQEAGAVPTLGVTSPANGAIIPSSDVDVELSVQNFVVGNPGTGADGHIHYTLDGGTAVMKYDTDPISLTGLSAGPHTLNVELVDDSHQPLNPAVTTSVTFEVIVPTQVANLTELRAGTVGDFYQLMNSPTVTYTRTSRNAKYIQDSSGSAILIDDTAGAITTTFAIGDGMSGLVGELGEFNNVLQFIPSTDASVVSGETITPEIVTVTDLLAGPAPYQSELVQIEYATFADAGGTFDGYTNYDISDPSGGPLTFRPFNEADYVGGTIPSGQIPITGIVGEYNGVAQISARSLDDFVLSTSSYELASFNVYPNPVSNGFVNISSKTNEVIQVTVFDILGKQVLNSTVNNNKLNVSTLNTGVYILKISQNGQSTTKKLVIK